VKRARLNIFIERDHASRLTQLAASLGKSKSSVVGLALQWYLSPENGDEREAAIAKRLDRIHRQFEKLERDQNVLIETVALFVRYFLTISPVVPGSQQDAARAEGSQRYQRFITHLAQHLQKDNSLVREIYDEIFPPQGPEDAGLHAADEGDGRVL
jgi:hypothetical protein